MLKPFLYLITQPLRNKQKECNTCIYGIIKAFPYFCITSYNHENIAKPKELWKAIKSLWLPCENSAVPNICLKDKNGSLNFEDSSNPSKKISKT